MNKPALFYYRSILALCLVLSLFFSLSFSEEKLAFSKKNREPIVANIMRTISSQEAATTSVADSGSGGSASDMDVTCKFIKIKPDGSQDNELTSRFIKTARKLYPDSDFKLDEHGSIQSKILDTAVHDAKAAVPDFRSALAPEAFKVMLMDAMNRKLNNPDAYFTSGGNTRQVNLRMQTKSRLKIFKNGKAQEMIIEKPVRSKYSSNEEYQKAKSAYNAAMKEHFGINTEETAVRKQARDLFGDSLDGFRQSQLHNEGDNMTRGAGKYNTRIINNFLEANNFPPDWKALSQEQKQSAMEKLFPGDESKKGSMTLLIDQSFLIYDNRDPKKGGSLAGTSVIGNMDDFKKASAELQSTTIASMIPDRIKNIYDPQISMRDIYEHARSLAQKEGESWDDLSRSERKEFYEAAKKNNPELAEKLKMTAAGELLKVFQFANAMDTEASLKLKEQIMAKVPEEQREYVKAQLDLMEAHSRSESNRIANDKAALKEMEESGKISHEYLDEAQQAKKKGFSFSKEFSKQGKIYQGYQQMQTAWDEFKNNLDPSAKEMANSISRLDKINSMMNLIKVWQDTRGKPEASEAIKFVLYNEVMSRTVPGYNSYQMYKLWKSGSPQAKEELKKSLIFQGLTMLPGGAMARGVKLTVDIAVTGLQITIGNTLNEMGNEETRNILNGKGAMDSILGDVDGGSVNKKRENLFRSWKDKLGLKKDYELLVKAQKRWDSFYDYEREYSENQQKYQDRINFFYGKVHEKIEERVDEYLAERTKGGETILGTKEKLVNLLYADFINGLNKEVQLNNINRVKQEMEETNSILDEYDKIAFACFSQAIDLGASLIKPKKPDSLAGDSWKIDFGKIDNNGKVLNSSARVIPPGNTALDENNNLRLEIGTPLSSGLTVNQRMGTGISIKVPFKLINQNNKVLASNVFNYVSSEGTWVLTGRWTSKWANWNICNITAQVEFKQNSALISDSHRCGAGGDIKYKHTWSKPPDELKDGQNLTIELSTEDAGSVWGKGKSRGYTAVFIGNYNKGSKCGTAGDVRIPGIMDYACAEQDSGPLFQGTPLCFEATHGTGWSYEIKNKIFIEAAFKGAAFLCQSGGRVSKKSLTIKIPETSNSNKFLLIIASGHGSHVTHSDTEETIGAHGTIYYEYTRKEAK